MDEHRIEECKRIARETFGRELTTAQVLALGRLQFAAQDLVAAVGPQQIPPGAQLPRLPHGQALLTARGFSAVEIYGDLAGAPYDHTARRLVALARK